VSSEINVRSLASVARPAWTRCRTRGPAWWQAHVAQRV